MLRPSVGRLVPTRVTPDALTALRLLTGFAAALCFASGAQLMAVGAGLFLVSTLLDRADGELARQSGRFSRLGPWFDLVADCLSTASIFVGLGIGAADGLPVDPSVRPAVGLLLGVLGAISTVVLFVRLNSGPPAAAAAPPRRFDPDDMMLLVPPAIWCGGASWILVACGLLTPFAAILVSVLRRAPRARRA